MNLKQLRILNSPMELRTDQMEIADPHPADIERAFAGLLRKDAFAILSRSETDFLQALNLGRHDHYLVEYHEADRHFRTREQSVLESVKHVFLAYLADSPTWRTAYQGKPIQHQWLEWLIKS